MYDESDIELMVPSRRRVLAAGVWAAPVIVAASAAPAMAGSVAPPSVAVTIAPNNTGANNVVLYTLTFVNSGGPTTGFSFNMVLNPTSASGFITGFYPVSDYARAINEWTATLNVTYTKNDGVLPSGTSVVTTGFQANSAAYTAQLTVTANPTPGVGGTASSTFPGA